MFDEMGGSEGAVRPAYAELSRWLGEITPDVLDFRRREAELLLPPHRHHLRGLRRRRGAGAPDPLRRHSAHPLRRPNGKLLQRGLEQRVKAINAYIKDVYGRREILKAGIVPEDLVFQNPVFRPEMNGQKVPHDIYVHIAGIDIVRVDADDFYVLEDNARTPSGVSYMLENREIMMRLFPELFSRYRVAPVENYPDELLATLKSIAPPTSSGEPTVVLLTPGVFNSAYYEHSFLADKLGVELVEGRDLVVKSDVVYMRTTEGLKRVDVIYRRIDDDFLDPLVFRPDSVLGVPGPDVGLSGRQRDAGQRGRHRRRRRQGGLQLHAGHREILSRRRAAPEERADLALPRSRAPRATCSTTSRNWWSRRCTAPAATAC